jgi:hypothetical protein
MTPGNSFMISAALTHILKNLSASLEFIVNVLTKITGPGSPSKIDRGGWGGDKNIKKVSL